MSDERSCTDDRAAAAWNSLVTSLQFQGQEFLGLYLQPPSFLHEVHSERFYVCPQQATTLCFFATICITHCLGHNTKKCSFEIGRSSWHKRRDHLTIKFHVICPPPCSKSSLYRGFTITLRHNTLGMPRLEEWSARCRDLTWQRTTLTTDKHPFLQQDCTWHSVSKLESKIAIWSKIRTSQFLSDNRIITKNFEYNI